MALGYDWIAGVLDSDAVHGTESDSYYEELRGFRRANREECTKVFSTSSKEVGNAKTTRVLDEEVISMPIKGQCLTCFKVNERLFPVTQCQPVMGLACDQNQGKKYGKPNHCIRVSIPNSIRRTPPRWRHYGRANFSPSNSLALSTHCLPGWEASLPSMWRVSSPMNLTAFSEYQDSEDHPLTEQLLNESLLNMYTYGQSQNTSKFLL
jgi:hypothetical protein